MLSYHLLQTLSNVTEVLPCMLGIAAAHGLTADAEYATEYPVTVNDAAEAEFALKTAAETFGEDRSLRAQFPITGAEAGSTHPPLPPTDPGEALPFASAGNMGG